MWSPASIKNSCSQFMTPQPPTRNSRISDIPSPHERKTDPFHVLHKVPSGNSPYVKAKHVQLIDKEPSKAIALFWAAINAGDRVDSALKDMAIVMKQLERSDEAIEAIKSFRHLCPYDSQESIDNVLIELYKRAGRIEEEIEMLQRKLKRIEEGAVFNGRRTKTARSQGKKVQVTIHQERSRVMGNLGWAYMQLKDYETAKELYRKALILEPDHNKQCNLAICLMHTNRIAEAEAHLLPVIAYAKTHRLDESCAKSFDRALQLLSDLKSNLVQDSLDRGYFLPDSVECRNQINGGQRYASGVEAYEKPENRQDAGLKLLKRGISTPQDYQHILDSDIRRNEADLKYAPSRPQSQQSSAQSISWGKCSYLEKVEKNDNVLSQMPESSFSIAQAESISRSRKTHGPRRINFNAPATQPRNISRESRIGHEKRDTWTEHVGRSLSRKLCFEESFPSNIAQTPTKKPYKECPITPDTDWSTIALKKSETSLLSPHNVCRERLRGGFRKLQPAVAQPNSPVLVNGNLGRNSWRDNCCAQEQHEVEKHNQSKQGTRQMLSISSPIDKTRVLKTSVYGETHHRSNETAPGKMDLKDIVEGIWSKQEEHNGKSDCSWNPQTNVHIESSKSGKSWADLVEEEEILTGSNECCYGDISQEMSNPFSDNFDGFGFVDKFKDENRDSNISESDHSIHQEGFLRQKLELLDLVDGECAPGTAVSSRKSTVKRSIHFSQQKKSDSTADSFCSSPEKPPRKNRLQVFRDITPQQESPGV